jgi:uncharacterized protein (TIGR01244 family)
MDRPLSATFAVAPQISAADVAAAAAAGVRLIVCNRPDGEEFGQPSAADVAAWAAEHGLAFVHIPMGAAGLTRELVSQTQAAIAGADGPILAYCRSGTRSTYLWATAEAASGADPAALIAAAATADYDISGLRPTLQMLKDGG